MNFRISFDDKKYFFIYRVSYLVISNPEKYVQYAN